MTTVSTITSLPPAPQRTAPDTFADDSDTFVAALEAVFVAEMNVSIGEINLANQEAAASAVAADASADAAAASAVAADASADAAAASASAASSSASTASTKATTATTKASEASASASAASTSATTATTKASEASASASAASTSATTATTKASEASTSATNAAASATTAGNSATSAAASATTATTKASEASTSQSAAASHASAASASATAASSSATSASTSATTATTQASLASVSATQAAASAASASATVLGVASGYPALRPNLLLDFGNSQHVDSRITFTRASTAIRVNERGLIETVASGVPRIDFDPVTLACKGLLIEESRTNLLRNNTMVGASAGTPGTMPTNWTFGVNTTTGLISSVVGTGTENGITYVDLKLIGTASGAGSLDVFFEDANGVAALTGQVITGSLFWKLQAGSLTGLSNQQYHLYEYTAGIGFVTAQSGSIAAPTSAALVTQRTSRTLTLSGGVTTAFARPLVKMDIANGAAIDVTLRIGLPQVELGAFVTSAISTTSSQVTRAADVAVMSGSNFSSWYNQSEGTFVASVSVTSDSSASIFPIAAAATDGSGVANAITLFMRTIDDTARASIRVANTEQTNESPVAYTYGVPIVNCLAYKLNDSAASIGGSAAVTDTSVSLPSVDRLSIGSRDSSNCLNGHVKRITYYPTRLSNATLQALSA